LTQKLHRFESKAEANINQSTILSASKSSSMSNLAKKTIQTKESDETHLKNIFQEVMKRLRADKRFVGLKPTAQKIVAYYLEFKDRKAVAKRAKVNEKTINNYLSYEDKTKDGSLVQELIAEYSALEATIAHDEKENLIFDLKRIKDDSMSNREYKTAIDSIKQISVMRGFNAPQEMSVKAVKLADVLSELKNPKK